jgi:hypothetical protein
MRNTPPDPKTAPKYAMVSELRSKYVAGLITPAPCTQTLKAWFERAGIPRITVQAPSKSRVGRVYYDIAAVRRFLASLASTRTPNFSTEDDNDGAL